VQFANYQPERTEHSPEEFIERAPENEEFAKTASSEAFSLVGNFSYITVFADLQQCRTVHACEGREQG
jgi:hypothetical protein